MTAINTVNRVFRDFRRYTGDGLPGEPVNAPLPVGDPQSGVHNPKKAELRQALISTVEGGGEAAQAVIDANLPAILEARDDAEESAESAWDSAFAASASAAQAVVEADRAEGYAALLGTATNRLSFKLVSGLLADTTMAYSGAEIDVGQGDIIEAQGFRYEVAASGATDNHVETAGGVKLYVLPGVDGYNVLSFGAKGDYNQTSGTGTDDTVAFQLAINAAMTKGLVVHLPGLQYRITDTLSLLNANYQYLSFGFKGENGNSTRIWFDNAVPMKNLFYVDSDINYFQFRSIEVLDKTPFTSRAFYFFDTRASSGPSWKHWFKDFRITLFAEGARFDGDNASYLQDTHESEVMFLHGKFRNNKVGVVYNNIQSVNHQIIGTDFENDHALDATEHWPHIVLERGTFINHLGGSVIGAGPYLKFKYPNVGGSFQNTNQFASKGIRVEKRGGVNVPVIDHDATSVITLSNTLRVIIDDMGVVASGGANLFARIGGRVFVDFKNVHANVQMFVDAYMTTNLSGNGEVGKIEIEKSKALNYRRISDQTAYGSAGVIASNRRSIPAEIGTQSEGVLGSVVDGFYKLNSDRKTVYAGGWQVAQMKTLVYATPDGGGFGSGANPATAQITLPEFARPCKFRLLRDDINAGSAFVLDLYFVVGGVDVLVASITPTANNGGHFETTINHASALNNWIVDGVNWDGKMKVVKSGTGNGYVGLIMIDYM